MCKLNSESRHTVWGIQGSRERRQSVLTQFLSLLETPQNLDRRVGGAVIGKKGVPGLEIFKIEFVRAFSGASNRYPSHTGFSSSEVVK